VPTPDYNLYSGAHLLTTNALVIKISWTLVLEDKPNLKGRKVSCTWSMTRECVSSVYNEWGLEGRVRLKNVKRSTHVLRKVSKKMKEV
jgi:hypothetical protein